MSYSSPDISKKLLEERTSKVRKEHNCPWATPCSTPPSQRKTSHSSFTEAMEASS